MNNKKQIFDEYFANQIHESDLIIRLDSLQTKSVKGDGVIYTPWHIVKKMVHIAEPTLEMNIIEPSCGHGIFLIGLLYYIHEKYNLSGNDLYIWFKNKVVGVDVAQNTIAELKDILAAYFLKHFKLSLKTSDFTNLYCHDGLTLENDKKFNLCIGNPPYIRAKNLSSEYLKYLKEKYKSCNKGTIDIYFAFIEKYSLSADSLVFITPNSFLTSKAGSVLKNNLIEKLTLLIDFKEKKIFKDANVYTCIFKTVKSSSSDEVIYGNTVNSTTILKKSDLFKKTNSLDGLIDTVLSGIATLCDRVYIVKKGTDNKFYANHDSVLYEIEKEILVPYLKLTKIKSSKDIENIDFMIYPYNDDKTIIQESDLKEKYPLAYNYLSLVKEKLLARDKGKTENYDSWYAYGRKQGFHKINDVNVIVVPQMIGVKCKPLKINISKILNNFGKIVFTSGYIIPLNNQNKIAEAAILGKQFIEFAKQNGKAWPGKYESYYSLTITQIKKFKI